MVVDGVGGERRSSCVGETTVVTVGGVVVVWVVGGSDV